MVEVVARLGDETVHFKPLDHRVVAVGGVSLVNSQPCRQKIFHKSTHELIIAYLALLTFSIG